MYRLLSLTFVLFVLLIPFAGALAQATVADSEVDEGLNVVAEIDLTDIRITGQSPENISVQYNLTNRSTVPANSLRLVAEAWREVDGQRRVADVFLSEEVVKLNAGQSDFYTLDFPLQYLANGDYEIIFSLVTAGGMVVATGFTDSFTVTNNSVVTLVPGSCIIVNDTEGAKVKPVTELQVTCLVRNNSGADQLVSPSFVTYLRHPASGEVVNISYPDNQTLSLAAGAEQDVSFKLNTASAPQQYHVYMDLQAAGARISNIAALQYQVEGSTATILDFILDKTSYQAGDTMNGTLIWSGNGNTEPVFANVSVTDAYGQQCLLRNRVPMNSLTAEFTMVTNVDCITPQISVQLVNNNGDILDERIVLDPRPPVQAETMPIKSNMTIYLLFAATVLTILFAILLVVRNRDTGAKVSALFLLLSGGILFGGGNVEAATIVGEINGYAVTYTANLNKSIYEPGENVVLTQQLQAGTELHSYLRDNLVLSIYHYPSNDVIGEAEGGVSYGEIIKYNNITFAAPEENGVHKIIVDGILEGGVIASAYLYIDVKSVTAAGEEISKFAVRTTENNDYHTTDQTIPSSGAVTEVAIIVSGVDECRISGFGDGGYTGFGTGLTVGNSDTYNYQWYSSDILQPSVGGYRTYGIKCHRFDGSWTGWREITVHRNSAPPVISMQHRIGGTAGSQVTTNPHSPVNLAADPDDSPVHVRVSVGATGGPKNCTLSGGAEGIFTNITGYTPWVQLNKISNQYSIVDVSCHNVGTPSEVVEGSWSFFVGAATAPDLVLNASKGVETDYDITTGSWGSVPVNFQITNIGNADVSGNFPYLLSFRSDTSVPWTHLTAASWNGTINAGGASPTLTVNIPDVPVGSHQYRLVINNNVGPITRNPEFVESDYDNNTFVGNFTVAGGLVPPAVSISTNRNLIRTGDTAELTLTVVGETPFSCEISGLSAGNTEADLSHDGSGSVNVTHDISGAVGNLEKTGIGYTTVSVDYQISNVDAFRSITVTCSGAGFVDQTERLNISVTPKVLES